VQGLVSLDTGEHEITASKCHHFLENGNSPIA
jgi:hypothetical protein